MDKTFFTRNRQAFRQAVDSDVIILAGNVSMQRTNDASYAFEQEASFWYLTGIEAAGWWLIMTHDKSLLVAPLVDEVHQIFDGSLSYDEAIARSGVDGVMVRKEAEKLLARLKNENQSVSALGKDPHHEHYDFYLNPGPVEMYTMLEENFGEVNDCRLALTKLRAIKQPEEIELIRQAIDVTIDGFENVRNKINDYVYEYEIEADFTHSFRSRGATGHAYEPIVAAGKNACTLHYGKNQDKLTSGELILADVGARLHGYAADITRTYAYGKISDRHKAVHHEVETAHHKIVSLLKPGLNVKEYFHEVDAIMQKALTNLDLLKKKEDYRTYFPHSISHGLGIDVHDALGAPETFQPGMVMTVEPGIYIPEEGIGVRIEDDILITETGHENLSERLSTHL